MAKMHIHMKVGVFWTKVTSCEGTVSTSEAFKAQRRFDVGVHGPLQGL